ncbi:MAG: NTP transferase domain-containing protein [Egibacteraceae bacterium]
MRATALLPCAGTGRRLGLPYPKELLAIGPGRLLIDETLDLLHATHAPLDGVVLVVDDPSRPTVSYVTSRLADLPVCVVRQSAEGTAWTSAVHSATAWLGAQTLVLLPDQLVRPIPGTDPLRWALATLADHPISFLAHRQPDPTLLASDGALKIVDHYGIPTVGDYAERPGARADRFDSAWVAVALRLPESLAALDAMHRMLTTCPPVPPAELRRAGILGAPVAYVACYQDLGTWANVRAHWYRQTQEATP